MTVLRINAGANGLRLHGSGAPLRSALRDAQRGSGAIIIMVHGYKFAPGHPRHCPHEHILSENEVHRCWKALSWPKALGLGPRTGPVGIAFAWPARGSIWQAYEQAEIAGQALAALIARIRRTVPHRPVRAIAHSLGARVVLCALRHLRAGDLDRAVLLSPAEMLAVAGAALESPAGRAARVLSVTSAENAVFDRLLEASAGGPWRARSLGRAAGALPGMLTLRLDDEASLRALARLGYPVAPRDRRFCHWSSYLRPGTFDLYAAYLRGPDATLPDRLAASLPVPVTAPAAWRLPLPALPTARNAP